MDAEFWHNKWQNNDIGFHNDSVHPLLAKHWSQVNTQKASRVFLPLCGKTVDIAWLLSQGHHVVGIELSKLAITQLFTELRLEPEINEVGTLLHYHADNIDIFVGDIFDLSSELLANVDMIYDRAALVALPPDVRRDYSSHLKRITNNAPQLLICFEYDQKLIAGPPFSIEKQELMQHYGDCYNLSFIEGNMVEGGLKGQCPAVETVWLLQSKSE